MKRHLFNFFVGGKKFKKEFRKQVRFLIVITLGFTIAFTWRQTIFDISQTMMQFFTKTQSSTLLSILTSVFITILSLIFIYLASYFLKEDSTWMS